MAISAITNSAKSFLLTAVPVCLLAACFSDSDDDSEGAICGGVRSIASSSDASRAASDIAQAVEDALAGLGNESFSNLLVSGQTGTAVISGVQLFTNDVSCGTDCIRDEYNAIVNATFDNYSFVSNGAKITGAVDFRSASSSTQSGLNFSSTSSVSFTGANIGYDSTSSDPLCAEPLVGVTDSILSIQSSGSSSSFVNQSGSLTTAAATISF